MDKIVKKKIKHLKRHFNFPQKSFSEIEKMYRGEYFDPNDQNYLRLLEISQNLCEELNTLKGKNGENPRFFKKMKSFFRKIKIINLLFPIHGILADVGEDLEVVIGLVDFHGCGYINKSVHFSKYCLVDLQKFSIFATKIEVGDNTYLKKDNLIKLGRISVGQDTWICAGSKLKNNIKIGSFSVIGAGAIVENDIEESSLNVGCPSKKILTISKDYKAKEKLKYNYSEEEKNIIFSHLKSLGFKGKNKEYKKLLFGLDFNNTNLTLGRLYLLTHRLCSEYNYSQTTLERKKEILDILFPIHGKNLRVGNDLFVDLIGTTIIGDNVTIGNHVTLAGNVVIKNNVNIEDNVLMYSTGHDLYYKKRRTGFSLKYGFYEFSRSDLIEVSENISIGKNSIIVPSTIVKENIDKDCLVANNKVIKRL